MALAHAAGIRVFATGGIGGAHRPQFGTDNAECEMKDCSDAASLLPNTGVLISELWDISADLTELARTPVLVVCAGAKSILDLPRTLESLETLGVPVLGYRTDTLPEFYVRADRGLPVSARVETPAEAAVVFAAHVRMGGGGAVLAQPCPEDVAVPPDEFDAALRKALTESLRAGVNGPKLTPFLLVRLAELTGGKTLAANRGLIVNNARLAAEVAVALGDVTGK
jgi:pseudouridine-5'-phosphate glycosidase